MASLRDAQKRMTRALLQDSALAVFADKGYQATTIEDIAAAAGTTRTTFYLHFTSKSELMLRLLERAAVERHALDVVPLEECVRSEDPALLRTWLERNMSSWEALRPYLQPAYEAAPADTEVHDALVAWFEDTISRMQAGLDAADRFPDEDRRVRCVLAFGQFEYLARRYFRFGWRTPQDVCLRNITDAWSHLLLGVTAADAPAA